MTQAVKPYESLELHHLLSTLFASGVKDEYKILVLHLDQCNNNIGAALEIGHMIHDFNTSPFPIKILPILTMKVSG